MGKPTGFLEYARVNCPVRDAAARMGDYAPLELPVSEKNRRRQAGRCMDCGVPMCQAGVRFEGELLGCPLHNLIPEWNDLLWSGSYESALERLLNAGFLHRLRRRGLANQKVGQAGRFRNGKRLVHHRQAHIHLDEQHAFVGFCNGIRKVNRCSGLALALNGACHAEYAAVLFIGEAEHDIGSEQLVGLGRREAQLIANHGAPRPGGIVAFHIFTQAVFSFSDTVNWICRLIWHSRHSSNRCPIPMQ